MPDSERVVLYCLSKWGSFRMRTSWPSQLVQTILPVISTRIGTNCHVSLSEIMTTIKQSYPSAGDIDMLNLKSYMECFPYITHYYDVKFKKRVDVYIILSDSPGIRHPTFLKTREYVLRRICDDAVNKARQCCDSESESLVFMINYLQCCYTAMFTCLSERNDRVV